jgi:DNA-binding transcriptional ArsR family regulator
MTKFDRSEENNLLQALRHPLRRDILREMAGNGDTELSPRELSARLQAPISNVSYHVRALDSCAAIKLVREVPVRGSVQHFYVSTVTAPWALEILGVNDDDSEPEEDSQAGEKPEDPEP